MCGGSSSTVSCRYVLRPCRLCPGVIGAQEDGADALHLITSFLLFDGRQNERTFEMMNQEAVFPRLLELIQGRRDDDGALHRRLLELLSEMSRIQRLRLEDLREAGRMGSDRR